MGNPLGQKEAVVNAVESVLGSNFTSGETVVKNVINKDQLTQVRQQVFDGIKKGNIAYNGDTTNDKELRRYVNGMIQNHFRKAKELNGGNKYVPATTGTSRRDPQLSNLKKLLKTYEEGSYEHHKILDAIATREAELAEEKKAAAEQRKQQKIIDSIDTSALPEELSNVVENATN